MTTYRPSSTMDSRSDATDNYLRTTDSRPMAALTTRCRRAVCLNPSTITSSVSFPLISLVASMTILYFGVARDCAGRASEEIDVAGGLSVAELWSELIERHPELASCRSISRIAVDMEYVDEDRALAGAREVAIIPPVAGG